MKESFKAIGTVWNIDFENANGVAAVGIFAKIRARIEVFERDYSRFRQDSIVARMAKEAGSYAMPEDFGPMISLYRTLYELTRGTVTPLIGQTLVDTGYDAEYSLTPKESIRIVPAWDDVMTFENGTLTVKTPLQLDFGALGKGYIVDIVSQMLIDEGVTEFTVDAGGDIRYHSDSKEILRVGLENPFDVSQAIGVAELRSDKTAQSICGSSGNRRRWDKYHHIINPNTLQSPQDFAAVWVVAENTMMADGLTTALFFLQPENLLATFTFEYVIVKSDGSALISQGFPGNLF